MTFRWLRTTALLGGLAFAFAAGCGDKNSGGPPESPCDPNGFSKSHPPYCGEECKAKCGCLDCIEGSSWKIGETDYVCHGGCLDFGTGLGGAAGGGGAGGDGGPGGTGGSAGASGQGGASGFGGNPGGGGFGNTSGSGGFGGSSNDGG